MLFSSLSAEKMALLSVQGRERGGKMVDHKADERVVDGVASSFSKMESLLTMEEEMRRPGEKRSGAVKKKGREREQIRRMAERRARATCERIPGT